MPASRPRKKTQQKQAASARAAHSKARMQKLATELNASSEVPACTKCQSPRTRVTEAEVPAATWEGMAPMREMMSEHSPEGYHIAYCSKCNEHALLGGWAAF